MIGLMIRSNDFHSPISFEYTSPILNLQVGQARQWGLLVPLNTLMLLAHLSRRLIGELIVYPWSSVRRPSVGVCSQCSNIFFSETAGPIKAKFYVEPPWVGGTIFCSRHLGHMTKMAATPIYGKTLQKSSSPEPVGRFSRNLVCSIGDSSSS